VVERTERRAAGGEDRQFEPQHPAAEGA
jgi:hypothetical protein